MLGVLWWTDKAVAGVWVCAALMEAFLQSLLTIISANSCAGVYF